MIRYWSLEGNCVSKSNIEKNPLLDHMQISREMPAGGQLYITDQTQIDPTKLNAAETDEHFGHPLGKHVPPVFQTFGYVMLCSGDNIRRKMNSRCADRHIIVAIRRRRWWRQQRRRRRRQRRRQRRRRRRWRQPRQPRWRTSKTWQSVTVA